MFKILNRVQWEDVEINEIITFKGCTWIVIKEGEYDFRILAEDLHETFSHHDISTKETNVIFEDKNSSRPMGIVESLKTNYIIINKLPKEIQMLWKTE
jgi:hypothetical protein